MTSSATLDADPRDWAIQTLGFKPAAMPAQSEILRLIARSDYLLEADLANAVQIVGNPAGDQPLWKLTLIKSRHWRQRDAVAEFQRTFFETPCEDRHRGWERLVQECSESPDLSCRLQRMKCGLSVASVPVVHDLNRQHLYSTCCAVFLASTDQAAHLRREFCEQWRNDLSTWEELIDDALEQHSEFFQSIALWVDEFGDRRFWEARDEKSLAGARPEVAPVDASVARPPAANKIEERNLIFMAYLAASLVLFLILRDILTHVWDSRFSGF